MSNDNDSANGMPGRQPDYEVGFKKPPKKYHFKPGNNANPRGRPKGAKNRKTIVRDELQSELRVNEGGKTRKITKLDFIVKNTINEAMKGDHKARMEVLKWAQQDRLLVVSDDGNSVQLITEADEAILAAYIRRKTIDPTS